MTLEIVTRDVSDLKHRVALVETKLAQQSGQFEFISGQLRDVQLFMHNKFVQVDEDLNGLKLEVGGLKLEVGGLKLEVGGLKSEVSGLKAKVEIIDGKIDALPRVLAELLAKR